MAEEIIVRLFSCTYEEGGECTVPAGSKVVLMLGWVAKNQGLVKNFLQAQTTTISLNGAAPIDISDSYGPIEPHSEGFVSRIRYDTGVTLAAGESLQVDGTQEVSHVVIDGIRDETTQKPVKWGPDEPVGLIHCRITAS